MSWDEAIGRISGAGRSGRRRLQWRGCEDRNQHQALALRDAVEGLGKSFHEGRVAAHSQCFVVTPMFRVAAHSADDCPGIGATDLSTRPNW